MSKGERKRGFAPAQSVSATVTGLKAWDEARADFVSAWVDYRDAEEPSAAVTAHYGRAKDRLFSTPAPNGAALAYKLAILSEPADMAEAYDGREGQGVSPEEARQIIEGDDDTAKAFLACYFDALALSGVVAEVAPPTVFDPVAWISKAQAERASFEAIVAYVRNKDEAAFSASLVTAEAADMFLELMTDDEKFDAVRVELLRREWEETVIAYERAETAYGEAYTAFKAAVGSPEEHALDDVLAEASSARDEAGTALFKATPPDLEAVLYRQRAFLRLWIFLNPDADFEEHLPQVRGRGVEYDYPDSAQAWLYDALLDRLRLSGMSGPL